MHCATVANLLKAQRKVYSHIDADHLCGLFRMQRDHAFEKLDVLQKRGVGYFWGGLDEANQRRLELLIAYCDQYEFKQAYQITIQEVFGCG